MRDSEEPSAPALAWMFVWPKHKSQYERSGTVLRRRKKLPNMSLKTHTEITVVGESSQVCFHDRWAETWIKLLFYFSTQ